MSFTFPAAYSIGTPSVTLTGADGTATSSVSGQVVTITRSGSGSITAASTAITVALTGIANPTAAGNTGTFALNFLDGSSVSLDTGTSPLVTIVAGSLATISVSPATASVTVAGSQSFTATGADAYSNAVSISPVWTQNCGGSITAAGALTAGTTAGSCLVTATVGAISNTAAITQIAGSLATLSLSPASPSVPVGTSQAFTPSGADAFGNAVSVSPTYSTSCGSITSGGTFTAPTSVGSCVVTATVGAISGTVTITVPAGALSVISQSPTSATVTVLASQIFTATGRDSYGNAISINPTWSSTCGSINGGTFTAPAAVPNTCTVTATVGAITGDAPITVVSGSLTELATSPTDSKTNAVSVYVISFTNAHPWPAGGKATVTFPAGYSISDPFATLSGADGTVTTTASGLIVSLTRASDGSATSAGGKTTIAIGGVKNPASDGSPGSLAIVLKDANGNIIDTGSAPSASIISSTLSVRGVSSGSHPSSQWRAVNVVAVSWGAPEDATTSGYSWAMDGEPDDTVDGSNRDTSFSGLKDGSHTFKVKAKSLAGAWGPVASLPSILIDTIAPSLPSITSSSHPAGGCTQKTAGTFAALASDSNSGLHDLPFGYSLDGAAIIRTVGSSLQLGALTDGAHKLTIYAYDRANNRAGTDYNFKVDTSAPTFTMSSPAYSNAKSVDVVWSALDTCANISNVQFEVQAPGGAWKPLAVSGTSGTLSTVTIDTVAPKAPTSIAAFPQRSGSVRLSWAPAQDDRSGVDHYVIYRTVGPGSFERLGEVNGTSFQDVLYQAGMKLAYAVRAIDRAGNEGLSGLTGDTGRPIITGPKDAPAGLAVAGLQKGIIAKAPIVLTWMPVLGAHDYAVISAPTAEFAPDEVQRLGITTLTTFTVSDPRDGKLHYAVFGRDIKGEEGASATVSFILDTLPPASKASAARESPPTIRVTWTAQDSGAGVKGVDLYVLEDGKAARRFAQGMPADGVTTFPGQPGKAYRFFSQAIDAAGHLQAREFMADLADAVSTVSTKAVQATPESMKQLKVTIRSNKVLDLNQPFYATDEDGDGWPDSFVDPSGVLKAYRQLSLNSAQKAFLVGELGSELRNGDQFALWDPTLDQMIPVEVTVPLAEPVVARDDHGRFVSTVRVDKGGWILIPVTDIAPDRALSTVLRSDDTVLESEYFWKDGEGRVMLLDDPSQEYRIVYADGGVPAGPGGFSWAWLLAPLMLGAALVAWVELPSVPQLARRGETPAGVTWKLRHCTACHAALPRLERVVRGLHHCRLSSRVVHKRHWWTGAALSDRLHWHRGREQRAPLSQKIRKVRGIAHEITPASKRMNRSKALPRIDHEHGRNADPQAPDGPRPPERTKPGLGDRVQANRKGDASLGARLRRQRRKGA